MVICRKGSSVYKTTKTNENEYTIYTCVNKKWEYVCVTKGVDEYDALIKFFEIKTDEKMEVNCERARYRH